VLLIGSAQISKEMALSNFKKKPLNVTPQQIIYINSVSLSMTEVLGGGGRERPVK
jgi:hypothetical protein